MKKTASLCVIVLIISMFTACNMSYDKDWKASRDVVSTDGVLQITVPESYKDVAIGNDAANLQVANEEDYKYTMTIAESKSDFCESYTLSDFYEVISQSMAGTLESVDLSDAESVVIGDYDAVQFTLSGTVSNARVKYLVTLIITDTGYYQILSWSLQNLYYDSEATFKRIAESFVELQESA